jgi:SOS response regulatory protein OraA/RecX
MRESPQASEKCIAGLMDCFDERTGKEVQNLLDSLYAKGYSQKQICDALRVVLTEDTK